MKRRLREGYGRKRGDGSEEKEKKWVEREGRATMRGSKIRVNGQTDGQQGAYGDTSSSSPSFGLIRCMSVSLSYCSAVIPFSARAARTYVHVVKVIKNMRCMPLID